MQNGITLLQGNRDVQISHRHQYTYVLWAWDCVWRSNKVIEMLNRKLPVASVRIVHVCVCMTVSVHSMVSAVERCVSLLSCVPLFSTVQLDSYHTDNCYEICLSVCMPDESRNCLCVCMCVWECTGFYVWLDIAVKHCRERTYRSVWLRACVCSPSMGPSAWMFRNTIQHVLLCVCLRVCIQDGLNGVLPS